jgi:protein-S-isoprenylcysteine O-methyltransferase Ste14
MKRVVDNPILYFIVGPLPIALVLPIVLAMALPQYSITYPINIGWVGALFIAIGLLPLVNSFFKFSNDGHRSPHPFNAAPVLVISGFYSYVRNPMYVGVVANIIGIALLFANYIVLLWLVVVFVCINTFIAKYEEPELRKSFGNQYEEYCKNVHRWFPRIYPYRFK